ncbi:MAG: AAA family ATPase [Phycisphaerae bacterium]|nr:AAA family ATPase [Phycisphaerae bacterium]MBN8597046.1 AAA family ATPase [Planctomycetota bacterium]
MSAFQSPVSASGEPADQASRLRELFRSGAATAKQAATRSAPVIAVTSGKGGVGKTNLAVNLATVLAERSRISLVDADLGMANADILCGVSPSMRLQDALPLFDGSVHGRAGAHPLAGPSLASIGMPTPHGFVLVPGSVGVARMADLHASEQRQLLRGLSTLEARSDLVLLDTGAGISPGVLGFLAVADLVLVVATPEPTSIADAYALIKCWAQRSPDHSARDRGDRPSPRIALVINQCRSRVEAEAVHRRMLAACEKFLGLHLPLAGWIERDARVVDSVMARMPVVRFAPQSSAASGIHALANVIRSEWMQAERGKTLPGRFESLRRMWRLGPR